jgi:excisionase family DNA binding protein
MTTTIESAQVPDLSPEQVAKMLNVHVETIRRWFRAGTIKGVRLGVRTVRIPLSEAIRMKSYVR